MRSLLLLLVQGLVWLPLDFFFTNTQGAYLLIDRRREFSIVENCRMPRISCCIDLTLVGVCIEYNVEEACSTNIPLSRSGSKADEYESCAFVIFSAALGRLLVP